MLFSGLYPYKTRISTFYRGHQILGYGLQVNIAVYSL